MVVVAGQSSMPERGPQGLPNPKIVSRYRVAALVCAVPGMLAGLTALAGWILGNDALKGGFIENVTMKTNTAIGLSLAGLGLMLLWSIPRSSGRSVLGRTLGVAVALIGLATLAEHIFGVDLGIDQALFREAAGAAMTTSPNRMGPPGAICLTLLGLGLFLLDGRTRRDRAPYQWVAAIAMAIALIS